MNYTEGLSQIVLVVTAGVLLYLAVNDFKHYKIRNDIIVALACLFLLYIALIGAWSTLIWNGLFALGLLLIMFFFYMSGMMGGGDLKLLTVAFLWVGSSCALPFVVFLLIFALIHVAAAKIKLVGTKERDDKRKSIPFAPSVSAALIGVFMIGCMNIALRSAMYHEMITSFHRFIYFLLPLGPHPS